MADATSNAARANDFIVPLIKQFAEDLETELDGDVLAYNGSIVAPIDELIRDALEARTTKRRKLIVVLRTYGGSLDVVIRIVDTLRHHYPECVEFIVPNYAYSAGTVLAMSGDEIYMDYFSVLGPTDPQYEDPDGRFLPALGYVERYDALIKKAEQNNITAAEVTLLATGFDQGRLQMFIHQKDLAKTLLQEWLPKYKFKNWTTTETSQRHVDDAMRLERAGKIADILSDTDRWHAHGRGISMNVLKKDVHLLIRDFGENEKLNTAIRRFDGLLNDHVTRSGDESYLYTTDRLITG